MSPSTLVCAYPQQGSWLLDTMAGSSLPNWYKLFQSEFLVCSFPLFQISYLTYTVLIQSNLLPSLHKNMSHLNNHGFPRNKKCTIKRWIEEDHIAMSDSSWASPVRGLAMHFICDIPGLNIMFQGIFVSITNASESFWATPVRDLSLHFMCDIPDSDIMAFLPSPTAKRRIFWVKHQWHCTLIMNV